MAHICAHACPIAAPIYGHVCARACPIAAPIYGHVCAYACPIAAPIYGYVCAHACPIAAPLLLPWGPCMPSYMAMYARMHAPLLPHCCSHGAHICPHIWLYMRARMPYCCPHIWPCMRACMPHCCPIAAPMGPIYALIYSYICAYACPIAAPIWPIYARIHTPLSGTKIRTIRKALKRQALYLIWTSAVIGHILEQ